MQKRRNETIKGKKIIGKLFKQATENLQIKWKTELAGNKQTVSEVVNGNPTITTYAEKVKNSILRTTEKGYNYENVKIMEAFEKIISRLDLQEKIKRLIK